MKRLINPFSRGLISVSDEAALVLLKQGYKEAEATEATTPVASAVAPAEKPKTTTRKPRTSKKATKTDSE